MSYIVGGVCLLVLAALVQCYICCFKEKLEQVILIITAATVFTKEVFSIVLVPFIAFFSFVSLLLVWVLSVSAIINRNIRS